MPARGESSVEERGKENAMNANPAHMFFCGSIPLEHEVDVFNALAEIGGERLRRVPDGELGEHGLPVSLFRRGFG